MYFKKEYTYGPYKEVYKYHTRKTSPGGSRGKREHGSTDEMVRYNEKQRAKTVQRLILANFSEGDWHLTLSYKQDLRPESMREAKDQLSACLRQIKREYKKIGKDLKYIRVTERGKKGACHHHVVLNDIDGKTAGLVQRFWKYGHIAFTPLYEDGEYEKLAEYITKKETKEENEGCTYSVSRNMIRPVPKITEIKAIKWAEEIKEKDGYELIKGTLVNGVNPFTGHVYQSYMMRRRRTNGDRKRSADFSQGI